MKTIIVIHQPENINIGFQMIIRQELPDELARSVKYVQSFMKAIEETPSDGEVIVISPDRYDPKTIPGYKNGFHNFLTLEETVLLLSSMIKARNQNAKFYVYAKNQPGEHDLIDGFVQIDECLDEVSFADLLMALNGESKKTKGVYR